MRYTLSNVQRKQIASLGGKWVIDCDAVNVDGTESINGSIWRDQKDGSTFPNFDYLKDGSEIEANAWTSPTGKTSFFPPKPKGEIRRSPAAITKAMQDKKESIKEFQGNKEESIKISATMRDAVLLTVAEKGDGVMGAADMAEAILRWRKWLWTHWDDTEQYPPF